MKRFIKTRLIDFLVDSSKFKLELNDKNLPIIINRIRRLYNCSIENINMGDCDNFAVQVAEYFFDSEVVDSLFYRDLNGFKLVTYSDYSKFDDELEPHTWIFYDGKHYDVEAPNGVKSHYDLPIYNRQFKNKMINEIYSSDKDSIINFLNELPDKIRLYRGLILSKDIMSINKDNLGIHWSLNDYFVRNMFEYDTFKIYDKDEYNLWIIEAIFMKSDIDFEGTIEKRLIKDKGFFWDELTGEMIFNDFDDIEHHPYSHEDEILVKDSSTPEIIKIDKIDL